MRGKQQEQQKQTIPNVGRVFSIVTKEMFRAGQTVSVSIPNAQNPRPQVPQKAFKHYNCLLTTVMRSKYYFVRIRLRLAATEIRDAQTLDHPINYFPSFPSCI